MPNRLGLSPPALAIAASKLATAAANALALILAAHALAPDAFGVFGAVSGGALLIGRVLTLGCEHGYLRLRALPAYADAEGALLGAALVVLAATSGLLLAAALPVAGLIAPARAPAFWAAIGAGLGWAAVELAYWTLLARERYRAAVLAQAGTAAVRLAVLAVVVAFAPSPAAVFAAWALAGLGLGLVALAAAAGPAEKPERSQILGLVRYSRWQGFGGMLSALAGQQPVLLLLFLGADPAEAGKFALALSLLFGVLIAYQGLFEHLSVGVAGVAPPGLPRFLRAAWRQTGALTAACAALLAAIWLLGFSLLPAPLWDGGAVFVPLALAGLLTVAHAPLEAALHGLLAPGPIFWSRLLRLALVAALGVPVALAAGAVAMGWTLAGAAGVSLLYLAAATRSRMPPGHRRTRRAGQLSQRLRRR